ncbi:hypothetical protein [Corynebacterium sp. HMSC074C04]|uniref:hypothetical protein n=1 Tax=Corynebacterium sp. HMSC074C04 TaxID=1739514 RepID=UPI00114C8949|nr:hypothetical protein [Corynebacterium sp. HMSC074C04]
MSRGRKIAGGVLALFAGIGLVVAQGGGDQAPENVTPGEPEKCGGLFQDFGQCRIDRARARVERDCNYQPSGSVYIDEARERSCVQAREVLESEERLYGMPKNPVDLQVSPVTARDAAPTERICLAYEDVNRTTGAVTSGRCVVRLVSA